MSRSNAARLLCGAAALALALAALPAASAEPAPRPLFGCVDATEHLCADIFLGLADWPSRPGVACPAKAQARCDALVATPDPGARFEGWMALLDCRRAATAEERARCKAQSAHLADIHDGTAARAGAAR